MEGTATRVMAGTRSPGSAAGWLAWASVALYVVLAVVSLVLEGRFVGKASLLDIWIVIAVAGSAVIGALIVSTHPRHPIGWMFCAAALSFGTAFFSREYAILALVVAPGTLPFGQAMAWFGFWIDMPGIAVVALFLPLLFPDGHLPSGRWRPLAYFAAASVVLAVVTTMVAPATYAPGYPSIRNPIGLDRYSAIFEAIGLAMQPLLLVLVVVGAVALFSRVRRADADERQQIKWFAYAGALVLLSFIIEAMARFLPSLTRAADFIAVLGLTALPRGGRHRHPA